MKLQNNIIIIVIWSNMQIALIKIMLLILYLTFFFENIYFIILCKTKIQEYFNLPIKNYYYYIQSQMTIKL